MTTVFVAGAATDQLIVDAVTRAAREAGLDVVSNVDSDVLALVASPASAADSFVDLTVQQWAASHRVEDLLIVLAAGNVVWPTSRTGFDDAKSASALSPATRGLFRHPPFHLDLRSVDAATAEAQARRAMRGLRDGVAEHLPSAAEQLPTTAEQLPTTTAQPAAPAQLPTTAEQLPTTTAQPAATARPAASPPGMVDAERPPAAGHPAAAWEFGAAPSPLAAEPPALDSMVGSPVSAQIATYTPTPAPMAVGAPGRAASTPRPHRGRHGWLIAVTLVLLTLLVAAVLLAAAPSSNQTAETPGPIVTSATSPNSTALPLTYPCRLNSPAGPGHVIVEATAGGTANLNASDPGGTEPVATGVYLGNGEWATLRATGSICRGSSQPVGPDGEPGLSDPIPTKLVMDAPSGALLARVGNGDWIFVGAGPTRVRGTGELELAVNDSIYDGNTGGFDVAITLPAAASPSTDWRPVILIMLAVALFTTGLGIAVGRRSRRKPRDAPPAPPDEPPKSPLVPSTDRPRPKVFVSHDRDRDSELAHQLARDLADIADVWIAPESIPLGDDWLWTLDRGLQSSSTFVVVISDAALASPWVRKELQAAMQLEIDSGRPRVLPIEKERCTLPVLLRTYQLVSLLTAPYVDALQQVRGVVANLAG